MQLTKQTSGNIDKGQPPTKKADSLPNIHAHLQTLERIRTKSKSFSFGQRNPMQPYCTSVPLSDVCLPKRAAPQELPAAVDNSLPEHHLLPPITESEEECYN